MLADKVWNNYIRSLRVVGLNWTAAQAARELELMDADVA